jgi:hypothetical protein
MIELHPKILKKNGKIEFVVLPCEKYQALQELLSDYQDLLDLRAARTMRRANLLFPSEKRRTNWAFSSISSFSARLRKLTEIIASFTRC